MRRLRFSRPQRLPRSAPSKNMMLMTSLYWPAPLKEGMVLYIGHWMQFLSTRLERIVVEGDWRKPVLTFSMDKALVYYPGASVVLHYLEGGKRRVVGSMTIK